MIDSLLKHYEKELAYINKAARDFAARYPKIAGRLKLGADELEDPLVERLISAFSFLSARIQNKLEDDFPELSNALLDKLYPHYNRPIPPMSIVKFDVSRGLKASQRIPAGIALESYPFEGKRCNFQSCFEVNLQPILTDSVEVLYRPFIAPAANEVVGNVAIRLRMTTPEGVGLADLKLDELVFFIGGQDQRRYILYELLFTQLNAIVIAEGEKSDKPLVLGAEQIEPVGFGANEGMLPYPDNAFLGYRLLTEFFAFADKFFFFRLKGLDKCMFEQGKKAFDIYFYLNNADAELEHYITTEMFQLGCSPIVNLFDITAEPVRLDNRQTSYQLVPDANQAENIEIYDIKTVSGVDEQGNPVRFEPFYSASYRAEKATSLWHANRRIVLEGEHNTEVGSEIDLNFVDLEFKPGAVSDCIITAETRCLNRNSASKLPFAGQLNLRNVDGQVPPVDIYCVVPLTPTLRVLPQDGNYWRLISHLNLNHLSLGEDSQSLQVLQEILSLYDFRNSSSSRTLIGSIDTIDVKPISAPINIDGRSVLCRGNEVTITFEPLKLGGQSPYLFASVLESFMGLYCTLNSFVRVVARLKGYDEELKRWPPRAGELQLL